MAQSEDITICSQIWRSEDGMGRSDRGRDARRFAERVGWGGLGSIRCNRGVLHFGIGIGIDVA